MDGVMLYYSQASFRFWIEIEPDNNLKVAMKDNCSVPNSSGYAYAKRKWPDPEKTKRSAAKTIKKWPIAETDRVIVLEISPTRG